MSKLIGITASVEREEKMNYLNNSYIKAFDRVFDRDVFVVPCIPVIVPILEVPRLESGVEKDIFEGLKCQADRVVERLDALILSGGADLNPLITSTEKNTASYGCNANRDLYEQLLIEAAIINDVPIMGICRGFQILGRYLKFPNYAQELSSFEELHSSNDRSILSRNEPTHEIKLSGQFAKFMKSEKICINSFHHQGFTFASEPESTPITQHQFEESYEINILAHTERVIEAFEAKKKKIFAVQWHPEEYGPESKTIQYFLEKYL